jgi:hypothetical protein
MTDPDLIQLVAQAIRIADGNHTMGTAALAEVAVATLDAHTADAIRTFHAEVAEAYRDGASSNDLVQMLDDWFVAQCLPTVIYA